MTPKLAYTILLALTICFLSMVGCQVHYDSVTANPTPLLLPDFSQSKG